MTRQVKTVGWTFALVVFLALAIRTDFQWRVLAITGVMLMWYGLVTRANRNINPVQKPGRGGLN
jgi:sulfite exporter TauE/SafE